MKAPTLVLLFLSGLALSACVFLDEPLSRGTSRTDAAQHRPDSLNRELPPKDTPGSPPDRPDTSVWWSAVRFPHDYDWQRDTAYGAAGFELLLFRDGTPVLTLASGPDAPFCPDPDRHHILSGHLYTERMAGGQTLIGRDGKELFRFDGREFLVGLLEDGDDLYTLSRPSSGQGFALRKNGQPLILRTDGIPYGSLSDPSYGPGGALYRDGGKRVFCYRGGSVLNNTYYLVRDEEETRLDSLLPSQTVLDLKQHDGEVFALSPNFLRSMLYEGSIWPEGKGYAVTGCFSDGVAGVFWGWLEADAWTTQHLLSRERAVLYHSPQANWGVSTGMDGIVRWYGPDREWRSEVPCHFFSPACATLVGERFILALNPKDILRRPQLLDGGGLKEVDVYGYVSRVAAEVRLPAN